MSETQLDEPSEAFRLAVRLAEAVIFASREPVHPRILANLLPEDADIDAVIDVRAVFQEPHRTLALDEMPALLRPQKGRYGLVDYEKMFTIDPAADIFDRRGISRDGCMVLVRPDQYVAAVLPLDAQAELSAFFERFMLPAG